jgi:hypothetical protein
VGNVASGESLVLYLDNVPPIVDLDPGLVREWRDTPESYCSLAFDPVGPMSANDGAIVGRLQRYRALVWERTNEDPFTPHILYNSGTDLESVYLYLQTDEAEPLLINNDGDPACDDLDIDGLPFLHLKGITPRGDSWFGADADETEPQWTGCNYQDQPEVDMLCDPYEADLSRIIRWDAEDEVPVIFANGNLDPGPSCIGTDWETAPYGEGWACLAARAVDNAGNVGISPPLRVCIDDGVAPHPDCTGTPPDCTDSCTLPDEFTSRILEL